MQVCLEETWQRIVKLKASLPRARVSHLAEGWDRRIQLRAALPLPASDWDDHWLIDYYLIDNYIATV